MFKKFIPSFPFKMAANATKHKILWKPVVRSNLRYIWATILRGRIPRGLPLRKLDGSWWSWQQPFHRCQLRAGSVTIAFMKINLSLSLLAAALAFNALTGRAQTNAPAATESAPTAAEKHIAPIMDALKLDDAAKAARVHNALTEFFQAHAVWHQANDAKLKVLWKNFNNARSQQDKAAADKALAEIDAVYSTFAPQREQLQAALSPVLTPAQIETIEDVITVNKVKVTYDVYLQIFPTLTDKQKAVVLDDLKAARSEAVNAGSMAEKSAFFKKYKIKIEEDYLTAQGYDPKQARQDFAAKQKSGEAKPAEEKQ